MPKPIWTEDPPKTPGWYWFYGRRYNQDLTLSMFQVRVTPSGPVYVCDGSFMYEHEFKGHFLWIEEPSLPE